MHPDTFSRVALSRVPQVGPKLFRALIDHFGSAADVLRARHDDLCAVPGVAEQTAGRFFANERFRLEAENILAHAERHGIEVLCCLDADYPTRLAEYASSPPILYHFGKTDLQNPRSLGIVGTREMTTQGALQVERLLDPLVDYSPLIVSGLAYGVDIHAHRRSVQVGLPTLAVMGSGFNYIYPQAHARTAMRLAETGGGVLTAYPFWMKPEKDHFPARNRIVAKMSDLTVVVESAARGGSMITARMAHDLGRKVGACPGRGGDPVTEGCNQLIKSGRAHLITAAGDVVALLGWKGRTAGTQRRLFEDLSPAERQVVEFLRDRERVQVDEIHLGTGHPPAKLAGLLLTLELKGVVTALPGHFYRLGGG